MVAGVRIPPAVPISASGVEANICVLGPWDRRFESCLADHSPNYGDYDEGCDLHVFVQGYKHESDLDYERCRNAGIVQWLSTVDL